VHCSATPAAAPKGRRARCVTLIHGAARALFENTHKAMQLPDIFLALGEENFGSLLRAVSMGKLRTYQLFDRVKARFHLHKLNSETLRKAAPRLWLRVKESDQDFAADLSQVILVSHLDMIAAVLDELGVPHEGGFFAKDTEPGKFLTDGWQQRIYDKFSSAYPRAVLLFYINHLDWEVHKDSGAFTVFLPPSPAVA
jgi:hypothetical protein